MIRNGLWSISSETDPKWDKSGRGHVGGFIIPEEAKKAIEKLKEIHGEPPDDLKFSYMKD